MKDEVPLVLRHLARWMSLLMLLSMVGCPEADVGSDVPDGLVDDVADTSVPDVPDTDTGADTPIDTADSQDVVQDVPADAPADGGPDASDTVATPDIITDATPDIVADTGIPVVTAVAVPGDRCTWSNRIGSVQIWFDDFQQPSISGVITDKLHPWYGPPALETSTCAHYAYSDQCGGPCVAGELCGYDGVCTQGPLNLGDTTVSISTLPIPGDTTVVGETIVMPEGFDGGSWGEFDLPGDAFSARVVAPGYDIRVAPMKIPEAPPGISGTLSGPYEAPTAVDVTWSWSGPGDYGSVYTNVPINHHAAGPTFTECAVDIASQLLHIDGDMLVPLSVITGLEFQGVEYVRFAAAQTPAGCVEFRFSQRAYVDLVPSGSQ